MRLQQILFRLYYNLLHQLQVLQSHHLVEALTAGADMEVLRIKNARIMERALERDDDADTLDALDVYEVFERCLAAHGVPDEQRPDLRLAYRETVASFLEEDPHA